MSAMVQVIAKKKHRYQQQMRQPGETYSARLCDLRFLKKVGWAEEYQTKPTKSTEAPPTESSPAEDTCIEAPPTVDTRPKPKYRRRDVRAED
jgi:hypothetical protein